MKIIKEMQEQIRVLQLERKAAPKQAIIADAKQIVKHGCANVLKIIAMRKPAGNYLNV
jgi:hypothetical protein